MNYYISDTHFSHINIIRLCNRPFCNIEEMNETMISNWNRKVSKNDTVYFLGDFCFGNAEHAIEILKRLNGDINFILGNHDKVIKQNKQHFKFYNYLEIEDEGKKVVLFHYPILEWNGFYRDSVHLYGHVHNSNKSPKIKNAYNVSADVMDFEPKTLNEILKLNKG